MVTPEPVDGLPDTAAAQMHHQVDRTAATIGVSLALAAAGADILRVHDVRQTVDALRLFRAAGGMD